jgi:hypothetical protein
MSEENSGANNFIWAFALVLIVAILAAAIFYSGGLGTKKHDVDIEIKAPTSN